MKRRWSRLFITLVVSFIGFAAIGIGWGWTQTDCYGDACLVYQPLIGLWVVGILILIGIFAANVLTVRTCDGGPARTHSKFTVELLARNRFRIFSATLLLPRPLAEF